MRDVDAIAMAAWIIGMGINAAMYFYGHSPINATGLVVTSGGLIFSATATICMALKRSGQPER